MVQDCLQALRKKGSYKVEPIALEDALRNAGAPLLPCPLEGALCLSPTDRFEGFFVAKIARLA